MFTQIKSLFKVYWPVYLGVIYLCSLIFLNEVPADDGDGLEHFAIAQDSWVHPIQLLNHWGKPLFTLVFSPLAQGGFIIYALGNVVVYALSCWIVFALFRQLQLRVHLAQLFALILLTVPDYITSCIAGLTEPFFGLLVLIAFYGAFLKKWSFAAGVVSFLPFARSEGMFIVLLFLVVLVLYRQWKSIPLLGIGWLIYALIGHIFINNWNWYFENDPYPAISVYGSGPWNTYIKNVHRHMGFPNFILALITVLVLLRFRNRELKLFQRVHLIALCGIAIYLGILVVHSYLWYTGQKGAMGLSRLGILGMPLLTLGCLVFIGTEENLRLARLKDVRYILVLIAVSLVLVFVKNDFPTKATPMQVALKRTADYLKDHQSKFNTAYYFHPMIAYYSGTTTKAAHDYLKFRFIYLENDIKKVFKPGDVLVRDSYFGAREQGLPFEKLAQYKQIRPVYSIFSSSPEKTIFGEDQSIVIYKIVKDSTVVFQPLVHKTYFKKAKVYHVKSNRLYVDLEKKMMLPSISYPCRTLKVKLKANKTLPEDFNLVVDGEGFYCATPILNNQEEYYIQITQPIRSIKMYLYNPEQQLLDLKVECIGWEITKNLGL